MPKALIYIAAQSAIVDAYTNSASISSILEELHIVLPPDISKLDKGTSIPTSWCFLVLIEWQPGDEKKSFESYSRVVTAAGEEVMATVPAIAQPELGKPRHRLIENIVGFPIWTSGRLEAKLMIRERGKSDFLEIASYPILVVYDSAPAGK